MNVLSTENTWNTNLDLKSKYRYRYIAWTSHLLTSQEPSTSKLRRRKGETWMVGSPTQKLFLPLLYLRVHTMSNIISYCTFHGKQYLLLLIGTPPGFPPEPFPLHLMFLPQTHTPTARVFFRSEWFLRPTQIFSDFVAQEWRTTKTFSYFLVFLEIESMPGN